jgi:hypothetical protein
MKNQFVLKRNYFRIMLCLFLFLFISQDIYAQSYPDMKVIHKDGATIEGEDGTMGESSVTLMVGGEQKTYPLSDVQLVMVKKGLGGKYALYAGGGCAVLVLVTIIASSGSDDAEGEPKYSTGTLVAGGLLWVAIFAGGGYLIGNAADDWNTIYTAPAQSSILERFKFGFGANRRGQIRFGLSYNF